MVRHIVLAIGEIDRKFVESFANGAAEFDGYHLVVNPMYHENGKSL
jgi:hypothetical protein